MEPGTLFLWLFLVLAPVVALMLLWRLTRRMIRERGNRWPLTLAGSLVLICWAIASHFILFICFEVAWWLSHVKPRPVGAFPEGWTIYLWMAGYAAVAVALFAALGKWPSSVVGENNSGDFERNK